MSETQDVSRKSERSDVGSEPTLLISTTSAFKWVWSDAGSGAHRDVTIWRPQPEDGYQIVGDYAQGNYHDHPGATAIVVKAVNDEDAGKKLVAKPLDYRQVWNDKGSRGDHNGAIWYPQPPPGYVSIGCVATKGYSKPKDLNYACIRLDWAEQTGVGPSTWSDAGSGADEDVTVYPLLGVPAAFVAQGNYDKWAGTAFRLRGDLAVGRPGPG